MLSTRKLIRSVFFFFFLLICFFKNRGSPRGGGVEREERLAGEGEVRVRENTPL